MLLSLLLAGHVLGVNRNELNRIEHLMAFHQFWNAHQELSAMISREGKRVDNMLYRLRAQCALNMGMINDCITDAKRIIENGASGEDGRYAYILQARAHIQIGEFDMAMKAAKKSSDRQTIQSCQELKNMEKNAADKMSNGQIGEAAQIYDQLIRHASHARRFALERANIAWTSGEFGRYKELTKDFDKEFPDDGMLAYRLGIIALCDGQMDPAIRNLKRSVGMRGSPKNAGNALESTQIVNRDYPQAERLMNSGKLQEAERLFVTIKGIAEDYCPSGCILRNTVNMLDFKLRKANMAPEEVLEMLDKMIEEAPDSQDLLLERGDLNIELENYDAALFDFQSVQRRNQGNRSAAEGVNKAQELLKKASFVDHYGALGLEKGASSHEITDAYKKMVRLWHPDRYKGDKKKEAESMMKKINTAYDILGDEQRKHLYDHGEDPHKPMGNGGFGFNPFDMFFNQGGGGGGQQFHFRGGQQFHFQFHF